MDSKGLNSIWLSNKSKYIPKKDEKCTETDQMAEFNIIRKIGCIRTSSELSSTSENDTKELNSQIHKLKCISDHVHIKKLQI